MTAGDRGKTAPASEISWVKKALFVVGCGFFFLFYTLLTRSGGKV